MSSSTTTSRKETERTKLIQEKCQTLLTQMLRDEDNKYCVDCDAKGPRWASWNLGVFLCIRCAGIHRNLGVHISRVKSVNLDTWTPEQVISLQQMGNSRARAVYEAQLPDGFRRPQTDTALESFIRAKYEHKKYLAREWVPPSPPKVDWAKEIDEELERQKRKKKAAQANTALGIGVITGSTNDKKAASSAAAKSSPLPAPLPKPKPGQSGSSPKIQRISTSSTGADSNHSNDLLGLASPTKPLQSTITAGQQLQSSNISDLQNDTFSCFLSATPAGNDSQQQQQQQLANNANASQNSLAKEEEDFFNQGSLITSGGDKDKSGKLTKDSILALYGQAPPNPTPAMNFLQQQQQQQVNVQTAMFGGGGGGAGAFTGMAPGGFMGAGGPLANQQQHQFMTPPNSASMYNAPVMTAPAAFTAPGMSAMHMGAAQGGANAGFAAQFPMQTGFPQTQAMGGIMATGQPAAAANLMHTHNQQSLMSSLAANHAPLMFPGMAPTMQSQANFNQHHQGLIGGFPTAAAMAGNSTAANNAATTSLQQQFGNLNIGNVWQ